MYMNKELIKDKLYPIIDRFSERKIASVKQMFFMMEMEEYFEYCFLMMMK